MQKILYTIKKKRIYYYYFFLFLLELHPTGNTPMEKKIEKGGKRLQRKLIYVLIKKK